MRSFFTIFIFGFFTSCSNSKQEKQAIVPEVNVVLAGQKTIPVYGEYVGQIFGQSDVDVRSRVDGWIMSMHFKEGTSVKKGQLLYVIDDQPIRTKVDAAESRVAEANTMMVKNKSELDRVEPLTKMNALSQRDLEAARANYEASRNQVNIAKASLTNARLELGYTRVTAPVSGVIGISSALVGDFVNQGGIGKPLNTISSIGEVRVRFPISEAEYLRFAKRARSDTDRVRKIEHVPVELILADGSAFSEAGRMDLANRQIDPETGSLIVQAVFKNQMGLLRPGQYVKVRFKTDEFKQAVLVPQQAVNQMQSIYQVFLVNDSNKLVPKIVRTGARTGSNWIITEGISAGDKIAVVGNAMINPKMPIKPVSMSWNYDSTSYR